MKKNMGTIDRLLRIVVAIVIAILYFTHVVTGTIALVLLALAGIFMFTSLISTYPLYMPFGISTREKK